VPMNLCSEKSMTMVGTHYLKSLRQFFLVLLHFEK
jgi:4-alpha-glucanotransferase